MATDPVLLEIVAGFVPEAIELCEKISSDLMQLEEKPGAPAPRPEVYKSLARGLHTLKGTSATLGLDDLSSLGHAMEDVVGPLHKQLRPIPSVITDELLKTLDAFQIRLKAHADDRSAELAEATPIIERLRNLPSGQPRASLAPVTKPKTEAPAAAAAASTELTLATGNGSGAGLQPAQNASLPAQAPAPVPAPEPAEAAAADEGSWRVNSRDVVSLFREVERMREMRLRMAERKRLMDTTLAAVTKLAKIPETAAIYTQLVAISRALQVDGEEIGEVVDSFEQGIKTICTLPLRTIIEPLHRSVRDLCRVTGKEAALSVVGGELSIDRRILEKLKGPLVHLMRNALDHGIEPPSVRMQRGKHRAGALVIRVEQQGNMVFVEMADDGSGIDCARIREVAVQRGLFSSEELARMTPAQVMRIIFEPGFSTRSQVSGTSGRGVGMDVVLSEVQGVGGTVDVQSTLGQGTRFVLVLPADLGSCPILLIRCGEHQFGLPVMTVEGIVAARTSAIRQSASGGKLEYREELLPLRDLGALMGLREPELPADGQPLLIVQAQGQRVAIAVDDVIGDREQVVHPLPAELRSIAAAYQGAAIQGFGELLLVLRSDWVVQSSQEAASSQVRAQRRALVVDDSVTARAMHRAVLEAGGYTVHAVGSARSALEQLRHSAYDVIVCDVAMEDMDGVALTKQLRARPDTSSIPIMLVSMNDAENERQIGLAAGADGFLSKKECASGRLLAEITSVVSRRQAASP
jgi:two-component system, chemotaxis family, sensor kinase CheA